jgi:hypothetical protein
MINALNFNCAGNEPAQFFLYITQGLRLHFCNPPIAIGAC